MEKQLVHWKMDQDVMDVLKVVAAAEQRTMVGQANHVLRHALGAKVVSRVVSAPGPPTAMERIAAVMNDMGPATVRRIATALPYSEDSIRTYLNRGRKRGVFERVAGPSGWEHYGTHWVLVTSRP